MELQTITTSRRYRTEIDGVIIEATLVEQGNHRRVEAGNIAGAESGTYLGSFSHNGSIIDYHFNAVDRSARHHLTQIVEDFLEAIDDEKAE